MATIRINKSLKFRPEIPAYEANNSPLRWASETKEDIGALDSKLFDKLISAILQASDNARIVTEEISLQQAAQYETELFIKHGARPVPPMGRPMGETVTIQADKIVITQQMLNDTHCILSLQSFALMRDTNDSYLVHIDKEKVIIDCVPSSEELAEYERWRNSGNLDMEAYIARKKHFQQLRNGTIQPAEKQVIKEPVVSLAPDNSLNTQGRLRRFITQETEFLRTFGKR